MSTRETSFAPLIRVEKGTPDAVELAALTAVLLGRCAGASQEPEDPARTVARWRRAEHSSGRPTPRSWRA
ncbi:acyl-CoA carboxylase subunit epsilon [Streptomyces sp. NPDC002888]|uniref:acyl-CoA carboxylase subunit epsilon n=1 Tax=Streptomyces sp. NPDC002888 TaxID=3364668 RepID=UPI0036AC5082